MLGEPFGKVHTDSPDSECQGSGTAVRKAPKVVVKACQLGVPVECGSSKLHDIVLSFFDGNDLAAIEWPARPIDGHHFDAFEWPSVPTQRLAASPRLSGRQGQKACLPAPISLHA